MKYYFVEDAEYSMAHNTILMANQVIILRSLKAKVPAALHHSHLDMRGMQARTKEAMIWPGMNGPARNVICAKLSPSASWPFRLKALASAGNPLPNGVLQLFPVGRI